MLTILLLLRRSSCNRLNMEKSPSLICLISLEDKSEIVSGDARTEKNLLVPSTRKSVNMETFGTESNNELEKMSVLSLLMPWKASG